MRRISRFVLLTAVLVSTIISAQTALAAPIAWERVDVVLYSEQTDGLMLISGELPESVALPAEAEICVPAGSEILWIGEILGGSPSEDPALTYTKTTIGDVDVYFVTLTQSHVAQAEITADALAFDGTNYSAALTWKSAQDVPEVRLGVRLAQGAQVVQEVPDAFMEIGPSGYGDYSKTFTEVKAGDSLDLAFSFTLPTVPSSQASASTGSDSGWLAQAVLVLLGSFIAIALIVGVRRKMATGSPDDATDAPLAAGAPDSEDARASLAGVTPEPARGSVARVKRRVFTAAIFGAIVLAVFLVGRQATRPQIVDTSISQTFSQGEPCSTATIPLSVPDADDPTATSEMLFGALETVSGMNTATYDFQASNLYVGFCESETSEALIREALATTGLVAVGATQ
ncbi:MAG: hypothetical protein PF636_02355 [Actinomycetota bacterium]|jgi:hypothetical protein|nr:hypothetical protein [Actinomycetota bacterium]